ncbi:posttranslational modification protein [Algimonas arctica]|uniref:Posttranslational modification protein n=1 Tax=Algimonas arctica TaxID=1479486 RepID=A0A8J3G1H1_9PROT|nr:posttranslational modification protein [Algimonas arctica]
MLVRSVKQALNCGVFDAVAFSSDSEEYLEIARAAGAHVLVRRPVEFATDAITKLPAIRQAANLAESELGQRFDVITDLAVTSPMRSDQDILGAVSLLENLNARLILSACLAKDNPYFNLVEPIEGSQGFALSKVIDRKISARQAAPEVFALNGAVYVWAREELLKTDDSVVRGYARIFQMNHERSIDIDTELDFKIAEFLCISRLKGNING